MSRKRASGESSISKGADGRWHGYVLMGLKENGRRDDLPRGRQGRAQ